ncbi:diphosphomevalonate decarboxylase [Sphingobacteriales bacterium UPWRP_1]|nr:hypothetical protein BVG80_10655 [Sphingobacteriales bacterium TSM_CSM]PSJ78876.1 diphosphomevalonate decarboxylase [Sphingobacteriales bacterium UPWRP_1]
MAVLQHLHFNNPNPDALASVTWQSPSNIAIVKYWGKYGNQYPQNPSLSFTLSQAVTQTTVTCTPRNPQPHVPVSAAFSFHGQPNEKFAAKINRYLESVAASFPFLYTTHLQIDSANSFPHSSGIASSASGMSALALCLCSLKQHFEPNTQLQNHDTFLQTASYFARLGSGSACRSVYPQAAVWGLCDFLPGSSPDFAIPYQTHLHPVFHNYADTILLVSSAEKSVSSRAGHNLMNGNPFAPVRYEQANRHLQQLHGILQSGDLQAFIALTELEALSLHALMMTSSPSFLLMRPNTVAVIERIRRFRQETGCPVCFTLDAGPNVHVLYPQEVAQQAAAFIKEELLPLCENGRCIWDKAGNGPVKIG